MATLNFPLATSSWDEEEFAAIDRVIRSGMFTMGVEVSTFEQAFAEAMGVRYAVMVNSGSSANLLIAASLRYHSRFLFPAGGEVIVPAVSWGTTYFPLHQYGMKLKFVDVDAQTLNYDLDALSRAVSKKTCAIVAVNLLGNPNDFGRIRSLLGESSILIIEDNCESLGATYEDRYAGTFGVAGSYSSFFSHHIATMEGGVAVTNDEELYHIMLSIRAHGWTRNLPERNLVTGTKSGDAFEESFKFVLPGYNLRPLELSGAIGQEQIKKIPRILEGRQRNAETFLRMMEDFPFIRTQKEIGRSSWFGFSMVLEEDAGIPRSSLIEALNNNGVECRPIVGGNFAKNEMVMRHMNHEIFGELRNANDIDVNGLFVGNHHRDLAPQFAHLSAALRSL
jgi:CDP-6-deoxy-D-xylo-4-hexulose-3-dehydrase